MADDRPRLRLGTNASHWLSQSSLDRDYLARAFTETDVQRIAGWGMDHLRVPVDFGLFEHDGAPGDYSEEGLSWIDRAVEWTRRAGLWMVLDMHVLPGHSFMTPEHNLIWDRGSPQRRRAVAIWEMLARRYGGERHVIFELLNEPVASDDEQWHALAQELHQAVRRHAPDRWIAVSSNRWGNAGRFATLPALSDPRTLYTFHLYDPMPFTHQGAPWVPHLAKLAGRSVPYPGPLPREILAVDPSYPREMGFMAEAPYGRAYLEQVIRPALEFRARHGALVWCGEGGVVRWALREDRLRWYADVVEMLRAHGVGLATWDYRSDDFGLVDSRGAVDEELLAVLRRLLA